MTMFEKIKSMNIDEFAEWLDEWEISENAPWLNWWCDKYCNKCEPVNVYVPYLEREAECSWCEVDNKCKFFQDMDESPDDLQIIKMWLESEE